MKRLVTPLIHPAAILRGQWRYEPAQVAYLKRIAKDPTALPAGAEAPPPGCIPDPTLAQLEAFCATIGRQFFTVSFDIENAGPHLVCCGVLAVDEQLNPGPGVCFRFRKQGGAPWWPWAEHLRVVELLDQVLRNPHVTKLGHFILQHDIPLLELLGFEVRGPVLDTSVLFHAVHSEMPKGLQFAATLFCGAPRWKDIPDEKEDSPAAEEE